MIVLDLIFYFIITFQTPRDYFEVNGGCVQVRSVRDVRVSAPEHGQRIETAVNKNVKY